MALHDLMPLEERRRVTAFYRTTHGNHPMCSRQGCFRPATFRSLPSGAWHFCDEHRPREMGLQCERLPEPR